MSNLTKQSRSGFVASARRAHGGRVNPSAGAVGGSGQSYDKLSGSSGASDKTGGFKQKARLSSSQTITNEGS